jgi:16S rRNA (guanine966-N2)-methyltransferase
VFNWLREDIAGARCLDLFAGSGALGFEALSRGAASLTAIERSASAFQKLRENAELLRCADRITLVRDDALRILKDAPSAVFDIAFVDPPFDDRRFDRVYIDLCVEGWLSDKGCVYVEQPAQRAWSDCPPGWQVFREGRAGQTVQRLLRRSTRR